MIAGYPPFSGESDRETIKAVRRGDLEFPAEDFGAVSDGAVDLIKKLMDSMPSRRLTGEQSLRHPWLSCNGTIVRDQPLHENQSRMEAFVKCNKLKKQTLHVVAQRLSGDELQEIKNMFMLLDTNNDGTITFMEFKEGLERLGRHDKIENVRVLMEGIDVSGSKRINFSEFIAASLEKRHYDSETALWAAFNVFDNDNSGCISSSELALVLADDGLKGMIDSGSVERVLRECDMNGDGEIDFHEFTAMFRGDGVVHLDL